MELNLNNIECVNPGARLIICFRIISYIDNKNDKFYVMLKKKNDITIMVRRIQVRIQLNIIMHV